MDCISGGKTVYKTANTFGGRGARLAVFRNTQFGRYDPNKMHVKPLYGAAWEYLDVEVQYSGFTIPGNPAARELAAEFYEFLGDKAAQGELVLEPNPIQVMCGGLERIIPDGFELLNSLEVNERKASTKTEEYMRPISTEKLAYSLTA